MTFRIQAGGIYKLPFPFTDLSGKKERPALALNDPDRNGDVRFLFLTGVRGQGSGVRGQGRL